MNMIVNKSDLVGYEAVDHTDAKKKALAKIVAAWESKQAKNAARFGGLGFLAVSLAACNSSSDDTTTTTTTTTTETTPTVTALSTELTANADVITNTFTSANDSVTATTATLGAGDVLVDGSSTDSDTLTVTMSAGGASTAPATITGIENVIFNNSSLANAPTIDAANIIGASITVNNTGNALVAPTTSIVNNVGTNTTLTLGTNITGASTVAVGNSASGVTINAGGSEVTVNTGTAVSGLTINGGTSTTMSVSLDNGNAGASAGANLNSNTTITTGTGTPTAAITIANNSATGTKITTGNTSTTADTVNITDAAADTSLTVARTGTATAPTVVSVDGTALTTDKLTLSAPGVVTLDTDGAGGQQTNILDLSGNGAAATFTLAGSPTTATVSGSQNVTISMTLAQSDTLNGATAGGVTDNSSATTTVQISDAVTDGKTFLKTATDVLEFQALMGAGATFTVNNGATVNMTTVDQTNAFVVKIDDGATTNGTAGSVTLGLAKAATGAITTDQSADALTAMTVNVTDTAQTALILTAGATTDVTLTGDKDVTMTAASTNKTLNASAFTGKLSVTLAANMKDVTGGSGDDTFTGNAAVAASSSINGGAGNDQYVTAGANNRNENLTMTDIEVIDIGSAAAGALTSNFKASQLSGKNFIINSDGADVLSIDGTVAAALIDLTSINLSTLQFADTAAVVTLNVSAFDGSKFTSGQGFTVTGSTQVNSITGSANADTLTGGAAADAIIGGAGNDTIDGGAGNDTNLNGGAGDDNVSGGAGTDTINVTAGEGSDTLTGGAGVDTFAFADGASNATAAQTDTITDFTTGASGDKIDFTITAAAVVEALTDANKTAIAADTTLVAAATQAFTQLADDQITSFTFGGNNYVAIEIGGTAATYDAANDLLINMGSTDLSGLVAANFA